MSREDMPGLVLLLLFVLSFSFYSFKEYFFLKQISDDVNSIVMLIQYKNDK